MYFKCTIWLSDKVSDCWFRTDNTDRWFGRKCVLVLLVQRLRSHENRTGWSLPDRQCLRCSALWSRKKKTDVQFTVSGAQPKGQSSLKRPKRTDHDTDWPLQSLEVPQLTGEFLLHRWLTMTYGLCLCARICRFCVIYLHCHYSSWKMQWQAKQPMSFIPIADLTC